MQPLIENLDTLEKFHQLNFVQPTKALLLSRKSNQEKSSNNNIQIRQLTYQQTHYIFSSAKSLKKITINYHSRNKQTKYRHVQLKSQHRLKSTDDLTLYFQNLTEIEVNQKKNRNKNKIGEPDPNAEIILQYLAQFNLNTYVEFIYSNYYPINARKQLQIIANSTRVRVGMEFFDIQHINKYQIDSWFTQKFRIRSMSFIQSEFKKNMQQYLISKLNKISTLESLSFGNSIFQRQTQFFMEDLLQLKTNIKKLSIDRFRFQDSSQLTLLLQNNISIQQICIQGCNFEDQGLILLSQMEGMKLSIVILHYFDFQVCHVSIRGLKCLAQNHPNLVKLMLSGIKDLSDQAVILISSKLKQLQILYLWDCGLTQKGIVYLRKLKNIKKLCLQQNKVKIEALMKIFLNYKALKSYKKKSVQSSLVGNGRNLSRWMINISKATNVLMDYSFEM